MISNLLSSRGAFHTRSGFLPRQRCIDIASRNPIARSSFELWSLFRKAEHTEVVVRGLWTWVSKFQHRCYVRRTALVTGLGGEDVLVLKEGKTPSWRLPPLGPWWWRFFSNAMEIPAVAVTNCQNDTDALVALNRGIVAHRCRAGFERELKVDRKMFSFTSDAEVVCRAEVASIQADAPSRCRCLSGMMRRGYLSLAKCHL